MVKYVCYCIQYFHSSLILEWFLHWFLSIVDVLIFCSQQLVLVYQIVQLYFLLNVVVPDVALALKWRIPGPLGDASASQLLVTC